MRKSWWLVVVLAVCLALLVGVLFFEESGKDEVQQGESNLEVRDGGFGVNPDDVGGGSGSGGGSSSGEGVSGEDFIPDIDAVECGFYFKEYGVCAGTCPDGECVSEGRSCYCKNT
ncbi:MAG: hypothetical protein V1889_01375 [archaeon]